MTIKPGTNYTVTKHSGIGGVISVTKDPVSPTISGRLHLNAKTFVVPSSDVNNSDFIIQADHGLSDGDAVVYHSMGYIRGDNSTRPILRNTAIMNPQTSEVDVSNDTINDANLAHGCETGDTVFYSNGGGTSIGGVGNDSDYYAIKVDDNTIKLATSYDNAINDVAVDISGTGNNLSKFYRYFQDNETFYVGHHDGQPTRLYLFDNQTTALTGTGDGSGAIVMNDSLKGNTTQTFSTTLGKLDPTTDA